MRFPHARGGVSTIEAITIRPTSFSPRPWGCFYMLYHRRAPLLVFPTPVGVFLITLMNIFISFSFPHARGGVSKTNHRSGGAGLFSPRPWGCFHAKSRHYLPDFVFPTPVGVFPDHRGGGARFDGFPHARGGVSCQAVYQWQFCQFSPRPWGCFSQQRFCH